jgi:hydroxymethylpyrimidine/phosphomethylpyrimidine kinase
MPDRPTVLTVHAVDTLGEEGVIVDSAACADLECDTVHVITALLAASPSGATTIEGASPALITAQFEVALANSRPAAARTGMFTDPRQIEIAAGVLSRSGLRDIVVAPLVRVAGARVMDDSSLEATRRLLFPIAKVVVVRAGDVPSMGGEKIRDVAGLRKAADDLGSQGARNVLISGALCGGRVIDLLREDGKESVFDATRIVGPRIGGVSGAHAAAIAAHLARGEELHRAVDAAQRYVALRLMRGR